MANLTIFYENGRGDRPCLDHRVPDNLSRYYVIIYTV
jgi:hypothetical protein